MDRRHRSPTSGALAPRGKHLNANTKRTFAIILIAIAAIIWLLSSIPAPKAGATAQPEVTQRVSVLRDGGYLVEYSLAGGDPDSEFCFESNATFTGYPFGEFQTQPGRYCYEADLSNLHLMFYLADTKSGAQGALQVGASRYPFAVGNEIYLPLVEGN